ncbi:unnamed protein product [Calypogeia fissa]
MDLTSDWILLEKAVTKVSNRHKHRELDKEAVFERSSSLKSKSESKSKEERKAEPSVVVEDLSELMRNLTILTTKFVETKGQLQVVAAPKARGEVRIQVGRVCGAIAPPTLRGNVLNSMRLLRKGW